MKINFKSVDKIIELKNGDEKNILDICHDNKIHLDHACGGNAACSTCHIKVVKGMEFFNEIDDTEEDLIDGATDPDLNSRLGCQAIPDASKDGEIEIVFPEQKGLH
jgi:2Fe-2S ferredoxin